MNLMRGDRNSKESKVLLSRGKRIKKNKKTTSPNPFQFILPNYGLAKGQGLLSNMHELRVLVAILKSRVWGFKSNIQMLELEIQMLELHLKNEMQKKIQDLNNNASVPSQLVMTEQGKSTGEDQFRLLGQEPNNNAFELSPKIEWLQNNSNRLLKSSFKAD